jgi:predicted ATPase/DNA-binding SARP family transcriptional activator
MSTVRVLGPVDVVDDDGRVHAPASPIRRTLLALLALDAGRTVDADALLERAWNGSPPQSGLRALRFHISRLRAELGIDNVIVTDGHGYRLEADTDLAMLDAVSDRGDASTEELSATLAIWDGSTFTGTAPIEREQHRLAELRLDLMERLFRERVSTGDTNGVVAELTALCYDHPLREGRWATLITAHYRNGNQAEALRGYDRLRVSLRDTLEVDPSPDLRRLHEQVLAQDPDLGPSPTRSSSTRVSLPSPSTELIGRADDLPHLVDLTFEHRPVTVTGAGGIGKTSLATALAHDLATSREPTEVWWCDLAAARPHDVAFRIGEAIGLTTGTADPREIGHALSLRSDAWLFIDNCEHVVKPVGEVLEAILTQSAAHSVTTSRAVLGRADEAVFPLGPLDTASDAVDLFLARAARADGTTPDDLDRDQAQSICRRIDGIPLAIELVAARTRTLSLADIETRLDRLLDPSGPADAKRDRHDTMAAAIETSIELLDDAVAASLGALAVFAGGFDLGDAEAILATETDHEPIFVLDELVLHSLVEVEMTREVTRYRLLEPIRQYAERHLWSDPDYTRDTHLDHFLGKLEVAYQTLGESSCMPMVNIYRHDMENLGAVHRWALETGRIADDLRLYRPLGNSLIRVENRPSAWADETLRATNAMDVPGWPAALRMAFVGHLTHLNIERMLELAQFLDGIAESDPAVDIAQNMRASLAGFVHGDWDVAAEHYRKADCGDTNMRFSSCYYGSMCLPFSAETLPDPDAATEAMVMLEGGLTWARLIGARDFEAMILQMTGGVMRGADRFEEAMQYTLEAQPLAEEVDVTQGAEHCGLTIAQAQLMGVEAPGSVDDRIATLLEDGVRGLEGPFLSYALPLTTRILIASGQPYLAALCRTVPEVGPFDTLPPLGLDEIPEDVGRLAEQDAERLSIYDISVRAATALRALA